MISLLAYIYLFKQAPIISELSYKDIVYKRLVEDVDYNNGYYGERTPDFVLRRLWFAKYRLKKNENIWDVVIKTHLTIDTLATVNNIPSIYAIPKRASIVIPNMRGRIYYAKKDESIVDIANKFRVPKKDIFRLDNSVFFVPLRGFFNVERAMFFGVIFKPPLRVIRITSKYGYRIDPFTKLRTFHKGIDLKAPLNTPVYSAMYGKVKFAGYLGGYGKVVIIEHPYGYFSLYAHLSKILVKKGDKVSTRTKIGFVGNTGRSTGPHLHFEIRKKNQPQNPYIWIRLYSEYK